MVHIKKKKNLKKKSQKVRIITLLLNNRGRQFFLGICLFFFNYKFIFLWLCWVFIAVRGLPLVAESGVLLSDCGVWTSRVVEHGL